jgi:hypothetical protein
MKTNQLPYVKRRWANTTVKEEKKSYLETWSPYLTIILTLFANAVIWFYQLEVTSRRTEHERHVQELRSFATSASNMIYLYRFMDVSHFRQAKSLVRKFKLDSSSIKVFGLLDNAPALTADWNDAARAEEKRDTAVYKKTGEAGRFLIAYSANYFTEANFFYDIKLKKEDSLLLDSFKKIMAPDYYRSVATGIMRKKKINLMQVNEGDIDQAPAKDRQQMLGRVIVQLKEEINK